MENFINIEKSRLNVANKSKPNNGFLFNYYDVDTNTYMIRDENGFEKPVNLHTSNTIIGNNISPLNRNILGIGQNLNINTEFSFSSGLGTEVNGNYSVSFGLKTIANDDYSFSIGRYTKSNGVSSFSGGRGIIYDDVIKYVTASGDNSFNFSSINKHYDKGGVESKNSAILGGLNNSILKYSDNSAIIGGLDNTIKENVINSVIIGGKHITATENDTLYTNNIVSDNIKLNIKKNENNYLFINKNNELETNTFINSQTFNLFGNGKKTFKLSHKLKEKYLFIQVISNKKNIIVNNYKIKFINKDCFEITFNKEICNESYLLICLKGNLI